MKYCKGHFFLENNFAESMHSYWIFMIELNGALIYSITGMTDSVTFAEWVT